MYEIKRLRIILLRVLEKRSLVVLADELYIIFILFFKQFLP